MAYIDYPIKCIAADGYNENPERGSTLHRSEDGTPWIVNLWPETRYTFEITHPALSAEEQLELEQFYDQHIGDEVGWDNPRRQERWIVRMVGPPRLTGMRSGLRGDVEMTLVGYRGVAPAYSVPPVVSGLHQIGQELAVSQGTWQSEYPMQFEYQWLRNGEPIAGATDQNYTLVDDDLFDMISVRVTASSLGGSTSVETDPVRARLDSAVSWLYSDMAETVFVDTSGNTPATWGDPVGLVKDSSGNGNDFTQPTVTARPILGRVPRGGRRNLLTWTEDFSNPVWTKRSALTVDHVGDGWWAVDKPEPEGGAYLGQLYGIVLDAGEVHSIEIELMAGSASSAQLGLYLGGWSLLENLSVRILSGPGSLSGTVLPRVTGLSATEKTVLQVSRKFTSDEVGGVTGLYIYSGGSGSSDIGSVRVRFPSVTRLEDLEELPPPYQRVTSDYDITEEGVPDVYYLNFDGTDDLISAELPAIENGTLVIAGTNGIWIDDDYNFDGGTFSIGPTSYTNGPEGILTAIGDPIVGGFLVINRQLSQLERERVIQEMKECGAPGVFELGPELALVSEYEGTPITDPGDSTVDGTAVIATGLLAGVSYRISYNITGYDGVGTVGCTGAATTGQATSVRQTSNGSYTLLLTPTVTESLSLFTRRRNTATFTNVSLRQLELVP